MTKCSCFRLSEETKFVLEQIRVELGFKSVAAVIREFCWYVSHGRNFPGSSVDMEEFFDKVKSGVFVGKESIKDKLAYREEELTAQYISVLDELYENTLLPLLAHDGINKTLDPNHNQWTLNIQHTIMERCDVGLLDSEVRALCLTWYRKAVADGRISKLQKEVIQQKWDKKMSANKEEA